MIGEEVIAVYGDAGDGEELFEVQKLVRCKECKYFIDNLTEDDADEAYDACRWDWKKCIPKADDFCSYGEREGE